MAMVIGSVIVASVIFCSWSVMFGRTPQTTWLNRTETRWLLSLQSAIVMLAFLSPNIWVGITMAYVAIHPWLVYIMYRYGPLQVQPNRDMVYYPLIPVLWWGAIYVSLSHLWRPGMWRYAASGIIGWALVNAFAAGYQSSGRPQPSWWKDQRSPQFPHPPGLVGGSFLLAYLTALGSLCSFVLAIYDPTTRNWSIACATLLIFVCWWISTQAPLVAAAMAISIWGISLHYIAFTFVLPIIAITSVFSSSARISLSTRLPAWSFSIPIIKESWGMGIGLGMWSALVDVTPPDKEGLEWRNMHNDWLQSIVEVGVVPFICALFILVQGWLNISAYHSSPDYVFGLLLLTFSAFYAIVYFPIHDHMSSIIVAIGLAALGVAK